MSSPQTTYPIVMCEKDKGETIMHLFFRLCIYCSLPLLLSSCNTSPSSAFSTSALPASFTTENILKVHQGMSSEEIMKLFGEPKSVRSAVCGGLTGQSWSCTTWKYGDPPYDNASFTFSGDHGSYRLNSFDIDRD